MDGRAVVVHLASGRSAEMFASAEWTFKDVQVQAAETFGLDPRSLALWHGKRRLRLLHLVASESDGLCAGERLVLAGVSSWPQVAASATAFAAVYGDGSVATWGEEECGGDSSGVQDQLTEVLQIQSSLGAFAALRADGSVVSWGAEEAGDSSRVQDRLTNVTAIQACRGAFCALRADGRVVTWGKAEAGGDSDKVQEELRDVLCIQSALDAFAAIRADGGVVTWGDPKLGGCVQQLKGVRHIQGHTRRSSDGGAFAAISVDGDVETWGCASHGGDCSYVQQRLKDVQCIQVCDSAFAAIRGDGQVVTWGDPCAGGDSSCVQESLRDVACIKSTNSAFAALLRSGRVVTWGEASTGGDSSEVQHRLLNVQSLQSTGGAFAAICGGRVVTWGRPDTGGDSLDVQDQLADVDQIQSSSCAFAALRKDGRVVTWGDTSCGGDSSKVQDQLRDALVDVGEAERDKAKETFSSETKEIYGEVGRLQEALEQGTQNHIDEILHGLEYRVHRATRVLYVRGGLDDQNLTRMKFHGRELRAVADRLRSFDSFQKAKDDLKDFQACLEHLHGHAERVPFRRWKALAKPAEDTQLSEQLPLALVTAVIVDAAVDGMLIGLSYAASPSATAATDHVLHLTSWGAPPGAERPRLAQTDSTRPMPAMSKIAMGAGVALAGTAFLAPQKVSTTAPANSQGLRGAPASAQQPSLGLGSLALGGLGLAALASRGTSRSSAPSACRVYDASKEIGACDPLLFWDPIGYCQGDCTKQDFDRRRAVELKHGRICMFATIGMVWPDIFGKFDGYLSPSQNLKFADVPSGIAAISKVPLEGWLQVFLVAGLIETQLFKDQSFGGFGYAKYGEPGNFGTGYWGRKIKDAGERKLKLTTELNNGRLAMVAMAGMLIQNGLTGQAPIEQLTAGHFSPFNDGQGAFAQFDPSKELGACPPLGYWDPFGMMAFQDEAKFRKNRELELKHGRICMVATIGMIVPDLFGRFGGYLSPSMNLKFTDVPCTIEELQSGTALRANSEALPWAPVPEGLTNNIFGPYIGDAGFDPAGFAKNKRLLPWYREAELAHGRVCMLAVLGFTVQTSGAKWEPFITRYPTDSADPLKAATQVPIIGWLQIITVIALSELWRYENVISKYGEGVQPGDLGWNVDAPAGGKRPKWFGPTFTAKYTPQEWNNMKLREIKHCRLAMVGFFFMVLTNASTGVGPSLIPSFTQSEFQSSVGDFIPKGL
ncbi:unnamed protein product [Effrenium voratum]|nr:unnamed protein product [Effrenium voratum]